MADRTIAAHTEPTLPAPGKYVRFVNISREEGGVTITVRNPDCTTGEIWLDRDDWQRFRQSIVDHG